MAPRLRVVLDTNVVLSGIFFDGLPGRVLEAWQADQYTLVLSPAIVGEYQRAGEVLAGRYPEAGRALGPVLTLLVQSALLVDAPELAEGVCADPEDDKFLACAAASGARVIVSGDKQLRRVSGWRGIDVVGPRAFLERYVRPHL